MAVRAMVEGGGSFARLRVVPDATAVPLHIDLLDRDRVPLDLHRDIGGGARIRAGIELNGTGQRTAYWVSRSTGMNVGKSVFDSAIPTLVLSASRTFLKTDRKDL